MISPQAQIWERYAAKYTPRRAVNAAGATTWLNWTQYPDHRPDETVLGDLRSKRVLELGSGAGANLAHLATLGAVCTGIDIAPSRAGQAHRTWGHLGSLEFVTADALDYLADTHSTFDVVYSIFGAVWFTDPQVLFPLVRTKLSDGGVFAFSQPPAAPQEDKEGQGIRRWHLPVHLWTENSPQQGSPRSWRRQSVLPSPASLELCWYAHAPHKQVRTPRAGSRSESYGVACCC